MERMLNKLHGSGVMKVSPYSKRSTAGEPVPLPAAVDSSSFVDILDKSNSSEP